MNGTTEPKIQGTGETLPEGFHITELGPLPQEWEVVQLGEVVKFVRGMSWGKKDENPNGVPVIAIPNIRDGRVSFNIRYRIGKRISDTKKLNDGDILLVGSSGSVHNVGRTAVVRDLQFEEATFASFLVKAAPAANIDKHYLFYLLGSHVVDFPSCSKRAADGKYNLQLKQLSDHRIPLPPLAEQRAIAYVLRTVQQAKEVTERVIAAVRELKKSLMRHLFTYGPVPVDQADQVPLKETEIGPVPDHWQISALGAALRQTQYGISKRGAASGRYPMLRMNNLEGGQVVANDLQYVDISPEEFEKFRVSSGDVLFNRTNSYDLVGKTAMFDLDDEMVFASYLIRVVPDSSKLNSQFLNYYLNSASTQRRLKSLATRGVSQSNISATKLKGFAVPFPPLPEQREIARILSAVDRKIAAEEQRKAALEALFKTLLHHLMTGRVRVQALDYEED